MPFKKIIYFCALSCLMASCKAFKNITSSHNSTNHQTNKNAKTVANHNVHFLNNIEITPGKTVKSQHLLKKEKRLQNSSVEISHVNPSFKEMNLEKVDKLQFKYAILLDVSVEALTNITLLQKIEEWWGTQYCWGGNTKNCTDCSAFTQTIFQDVYNIKLPRTAQEQYDMCEKIDETALQEGDLVFFHGTAGRRSRYISHVGIYLTNNKFVHASSGRSGVTISDLNDDYYRKHFVGGGRFNQQTQASNNNVPTQ